jgi:hypothetical protein
VKKFAMYFVLFLMVLIHTLDMMLTMHYIGSNWQRETFPLMRLCISQFGIHPSLWISRVFMYCCFYLFLCKSDNKYLQRLLVISTILYWTAMLPWLFSLNYLTWR